MKSTKTPLADSNSNFKQEVKRNVTTMVSNEPSKPKTLDEGKPLTSTTESKSNKNELSLKDLFEKAIENVIKSSDRPQSLAENRDSFEAAQRLLFATRQLNIAIELINLYPDTPSLIVQAITIDRKTHGEKGSPSLQFALLHILVNLSNNSSESISILKAVAQVASNDELRSTLMHNITDTASLSSVFDFISAVIISDVYHSQQKKGSRLISDKNVVMILREISKHLNSSCPEKIRISALNSMIKIADSDIRVAAAIATSSDLEDGLALAADNSTQLRNLLPLALTTFFCTAKIQIEEDKSTLPENFLDIVQKNVYTIITKWLNDAGTLLHDSDDNKERKSSKDKADIESELIIKLHTIQNKAISALTAVFISSPLLAERFLSDEQFCKDLCKLSIGFKIDDFIDNVSKNRSSSTENEIAAFLRKDLSIIESRQLLDLSLLECFTISVNTSRKMQKEILESKAFNLIEYYAQIMDKVNVNSKSTNNKKNNKTPASIKQLKGEKYHVERRLANLASVILIKCAAVAKQLNLPELISSDKVANVFMESIILSSKELKNDSATIKSHTNVNGTRKISALNADIETSESNVAKGLSNAVEGLAYLSTQSKVKQEIAKNTSLLKAFTKFIGPESDILLYYGVCSIIYNVVCYRKVQSQEEKMRKRLADMASGQDAATQEGSKIKQEEDKDPLMEDSKVKDRGRLLVSAGITSALSLCLSTAQSSGARSHRLNAVVCNILLNLARDNQNRGIIAQDNIKPLLEMIATEKPREEGGCATDAILAIARLSIGLNPTVIFSQTRLLGLIKPISTLLRSENLLEEFEALMALTNFASTQNVQIFNKLKSCGVLELVEDLQFNDNVMIRRAATELICNMVFDPDTFMLYAARKPESHKLQLLVALSDSEDFETRRAASGALAILSDHPIAALSTILEQRGPEITVGLVTLDEDTNEEIHARGLALVGNLLNAYETYKVEKMNSNSVIAKPADIKNEDKEEDIFSDERFNQIYKLLNDAGLKASLTQLMAQSPSADIRNGAKSLLTQFKE